MHRVAILGLGAMGSRMARKLLDAGHQVAVYNRSPERARALEAEGATVAATPRQAAERSEMVISMVTDDDASRAIWLEESTGAIHGLGEGTIAIESSTLTLAWVRRLAEALGSRGTDFLDAPVAGSRPQAEAGQLVYLVGGAPSAFERAKPLLEVMGAAIHHVGPLGQGMVLKLAVNSLFSLQVAAMAELLGLVRKAGIDENRAVEVLGQMPVTSPAAKGAAALIAARDFAPMFPIDLVEKDLRYLLESARSVEAEVPATAAVRELYARAINEGYGDNNIAGIARLFL